MDPPYILSDGENNPYQTLKGMHGYDPLKCPNMDGIFYASGPNIQAGLRLEPFCNIEIYPFIAEILKLPIPDNLDGDGSPLKPLLKKAK